MKALICEMCGSQDVIKKDGLFVCQHCGTKYSVEEAKKMMIEGTVKIDNSDELRNLYELARRAKEAKNNENAAKYYDLILIKDPSSWEANFFTVYFKAMTCKIAEISSAATNVNNCIHSTFVLIRDMVPDTNDRINAVDEIVQKSYSISNMLYKAANNHFDNINPVIKDNYQMEHLNNVIASCGIQKAVCDEICTVFENDDAVLSTVGIRVLKNRIAEGIAISQEDLYARTITKYDPSYQIPNKQTAADILENLPKLEQNDSGGCYIATAVYGSYDCPEVWTLRRYRDNTLAASWYGRLFIHTYYAISPTLVKFFGNSERFKSFWIKKLDKMIYNLQANGVESTPYFDKKW